MKKIKPLNDACWALFEKDLERPRDLTMANFEKFYNEQTNKFRQFFPQLEEFHSNITNNQSFAEKNRTKIDSFYSDLKYYNFFGTLETLFQLINAYSNLKDDFNSHTTEENARRQASKTQSTPTESNTPSTNTSNQSHKKPETDKVYDKQKEQIKEKLSKYRTRIEKNKNAKEEPDYAHGFWFYEKSRAINRKINYLIAGKLLEFLNSNPGNFSTFEQIVKLRMDIVEQLTEEEKKHYVDRGINSAELNEIIDTVKSFKK
jgi:hypothetical protein